MISFYDFFVRAPVNAEAAKMFSFNNNIEKNIDDTEIKFLIKRLMRKRKLLNIALDVKTKAQRKNLKWKVNHKIGNLRSTFNTRGVDEWMRNGLAIELLNIELEHRRVSHNG